MRVLSAKFRTSFRLAGSSYIPTNSAQGDLNTNPYRCISTIVVDGDIGFSLFGCSECEKQL